MATQTLPEWLDCAGWKSPRWKRAIAQILNEIQEIFLPCHY
ncbi:hypothetical protein [Chroococcidiopsis cubana]|nr:hypothetical protein [Chroococcidiopsis cubana]